MKDEDESFRSIGSLDANEWRGLMNLANALGEFEPLEKRPFLGIVVLGRLVRMGLAEEGSTSERYAPIGIAIGYRLTTLGWRIRERGRRPR